MQNLPITVRLGAELGEAAPTPSTHPYQDPNTKLSPTPVRLAWPST